MEKELYCYRGRVLTLTDIGYIKKLITEHPKSSRRDLSKRLCVAWDWRQDNGALKDMVCRGLIVGSLFTIV